MNQLTAPGPRGYPGVGVLPRLARDPIAFCTAAMREHDDLVRLDLGFAAAYLPRGRSVIRVFLSINQAGIGLLASHSGTQSLTRR